MGASEWMSDSGTNSVNINFTGLLSGNYEVIMYGMNATGNSNSTFTINNITQTTGNCTLSKGRSGSPSHAVVRSGYIES
jgi:hypothetical protein